jgi:transposase
MQRCRGFLEDATPKLSGTVRLLLAQLDPLVIRLEEVEPLVKKIAQESEVCRRRDAIPGVGPLTATALMAAAVTARPFVRAGSSQLGLG